MENSVENTLVIPSTNENLLLKIENKIQFQCEEIKKSERLISQLKECYSQQKEMICKLSENKNQALQERSELIKDIKKLNKNFDANNDGLLLDKETELVVQSIINGIMKSKQEEVKPCSDLANLKRNIESNDTVTPKKKPALDYDRKEVFFFCISEREIEKVFEVEENRTIKRIVTCADSLFVCGTGGLLVRFSPSRTVKTQVYTTPSQDDMVDLIISDSSMSVCSQRFVLIFGDLNEDRLTKKQTFKSTIGGCHLHRASVYVPLASGDVWNVNVPMCKFQKCFSMENAMVLACLKYSSCMVLLLHDGTVIQRVSSANTEIGQMTGARQLGHTPVGWWFAVVGPSQLFMACQQTCRVTQIIHVDHRISLVHCSSHMLLILDEKVNLYVYRYENKFFVFDKLVPLKFARNVSAMSVSEAGQVFVATGHLVYRITV